MPTGGDASVSSTARNRQRRHRRALDDDVNR
jgi:hypothetical protein